jgi:iron complex transport system ATP-binding protein
MASGHGARQTVVPAPVHRSAEFSPAADQLARPHAPPMIELDHLTVRFDATTAVHDITESVAHSEWVGLIGANGAGKTTLLRAVAHLEHHDGTVRVDGHLTRDLPRRRRAQLVAYVPQNPQLPADMTVLDYTILGRTPHIGFFGAESEEDRRICAELLGRLELTSMAGRRLSTLSGGELQRIVLARALAQNAPVLLLDEPTSALDVGRRVDALELVDELRRERGLTVLSALHDLTLAGQFADRLVLLSRGAVAASGPPGNVLDETLLSEHFGGRVNVFTTADGELAVVPRRALRPERWGNDRSDGTDERGVT